MRTRDLGRWAALVSSSPARRARWLRAGRDGLSLAGVVVLVALAIGGSGIDAHAYWSFDPAHPYVDAVTNLSAPDGFRYAPPVALLLAPLHAIPWPVFRLLWLGLEVACLWLLLGRWAFAALAFYPVALELWGGNVNLMVAIAIAAGFRWPAAWSFVLLTKVAPGIGLLWFVARREWRALGIALGATVLIVAVGLLTTPDLWAQWFAALVAESQLPVLGHPLVDLPLTLRLAAAVVVVVWSALTNRPWGVFVGSFLALPTIWWSGPSVLVGIAAWGGRGDAANRRRSPG
jgi:hypothetical protein